MRLCIPLFLIAAACGGGQQTETLAESIRSFNEGVRWQRFEVAAVSIPPRERSNFVEAMDERTKDLRITDYEIVRVDRFSAAAAKVQVKVSWYRDSEGLLKETHAMQRWERKGKAWLMVDQTRYRGDEMPGLLEPLRDETAEPDVANEPQAKAP